MRAPSSAGEQFSTSLFRKGTTIIGYVECDPDAATTWAKIASTDVNARWQEWFKDVIVTLTDENGEVNPVR